MCSVCPAAVDGRSGGFDKGRRLVRLLAIGLASGLPAFSPMEPPRGTLVKSAATAANLPRRAAARLLLFAPARPAYGPGRSGSGSGSVGQAAVSAARAARTGRLDKAFAAHLSVP